MFEKIYKSKKAETRATVGKDATLKSKLEQLTAAFEAGLLTAEEYARKILRAM